MFSANQKRVSFIVSLNEPNSEKTNDESKKVDSNCNNEIVNPSVEKEKLTTNNTASTSGSVQIKPIVMSGFKQKHFPKLDSIYTTSQDVASSDGVMHRQKNHQLDSLQLDNKAKSTSYDNYSNEAQLSNSKTFGNSESLNSNYEKKVPSYLQPSLLSKRHIQTHFTPSATIPHVLNGSSNSIMSKQEAIPTTSILKPYQPQPPITQNSKYDVNVNNSSSKIEISRIYSASNKINKPFSMSTNDLSTNNTKGLKLPPVNNLKMISSNNETIMIGGSSNNINSISINESSLNKKKITDLSRYCYFCQRKTGLASSYICRLVNFI